LRRDHPVLLRYLTPLWNVLPLSKRLGGCPPLVDNAEIFPRAAANFPLNGPPALLSWGPPHLRGVVTMSDFIAIAASPKSRSGSSRAAYWICTWKKERIREAR